LISTFSAESGIFSLGTLLVRLAKGRTHLIRKAQPSLRILVDSTDMATELTDNVKEECIVSLSEPHVRQRVGSVNGDKHGGIGERLGLDNFTDEAFLAALLGKDSGLHRASRGNEAVDVNGARLSESVRAAHCLAVKAGVPAYVEEDDSTCAREIDTLSTGLDGHKKHVTRTLLAVTSLVSST
jgi:hypothetical protein